MSDPVRWGRTDRLAQALAIGSVAVLVANLLGGEIAGFVFGLVAIAFGPFLALLGVGRSRAVIPIVGWLVLLETAFVGMWLYRGKVETGPWALGLPVGMTILLVGMLLVPLIWVVFGFAWTYRELDVPLEAQESLRRLAGRTRE